MRMLSAIAMVAAVVLVGGVGTETASAKSGCKKATKLAVEKIEGAGDFTLRKPKQIKAEPGKAHSFGVWLIAGRIDGGGANHGRIGTWIRFKPTQRATGLYISYDDGAKAVAPDLGADLNAFLILDATENIDAYDRVLACAAEVAVV